MNLQASSYIHLKRPTSPWKTPARDGRYPDTKLYGPVLTALDRSTCLGRGPLPTATPDQDKTDVARYQSGLWSVIPQSLHFTFLLFLCDSRAIFTALRWAMIFSYKNARFCSGPHTQPSTALLSRLRSVFNYWCGVQQARCKWNDTQLYSPHYCVVHYRYLCVCVLQIRVRRLWLTVNNKLKCSRPHMFFCGSDWKGLGAGDTGLHPGIFTA